MGNNEMKSELQVHLQVRTPDIVISGVSDPGRVRIENEDSIWLDSQGHFMLLADGMGGHERGAEASRTALKVIQEFLNPEQILKELLDITGGSGVPPEIVGTWSLVDKAISKAASVLYTRNQELKLERYMGTTVVGLVPVAGRYFLWFHIGDSRLYRWRDSSLKQLTVDHSAYVEWVNNGRSGKEPGKNIITRAIGPNSSVAADIEWDEWRHGDTYLICSDGLNDMLTDDKITRILSTGKDMDDTALRLVEAANDAGGLDNISAVLCGV